MSRISCERTRALVSCGVDGRLHDLEQRFVDAHLERCDDCRAFAEHVQWFTGLIREAPLESTWPVVLPRRRRLVNARSLASAAAAAVVLVVAGGLVAGGPHGDPAEVGLGSQRLDPSLESLQSLLRDDLVHGRIAVVSVPADSGLGAVKPVLPASG